MIEQKENLIRLHYADSMTRPLLKKILQIDPLLEHFFHNTAQQISTTYKIPLQRAAALHLQLHDSNIMKKLDNFFKQYSVVTWLDADFPPLLRTIPDPPLVLYMYGNPSLLSSSRMLSVIGTRTPSKEAYPAMRTILVPVINEGYTIVSGMAKGIDQFAHRLAIEQDGKTIAVLGSGFHHIYPRNDMQLCRVLRENHLLISEYPPDHPPRKYYFPERNRIISGLSPATFVVEARVKSGSLITVEQALDQGRDVYAMPGRPGNPTSEGCHQMINDGAKLVHDANDLLQY